MQKESKSQQVSFELRQIWGDQLGVSHDKLLGLLLQKIEDNNQLEEIRLQQNDLNLLNSTLQQTLTTAVINRLQEIMKIIPEDRMSKSAFDKRQSHSYLTEAFLSDIGGSKHNKELQQELFTFLVDVSYAKQRILNILGQQIKSDSRVQSQQQSYNSWQQPQQGPYFNPPPPPQQNMYSDIPPQIDNRLQYANNPESLDNTYLNPPPVGGDPDIVNTYQNYSNEGTNFIYNNGIKSTQGIPKSSESYRQESIQQIGQEDGTIYNNLGYPPVQPREISQQAGNDYYIPAVDQSQYPPSTIQQQQQPQQQQYMPQPPFVQQQKFRPDEEFEGGQYNPELYRPSNVQALQNQQQFQSSSQLPGYQIPAVSPNEQPLEFQSQLKQEQPQFQSNPESNQYMPASKKQSPQEFYSQPLQPQQIVNGIPLQSSDQSQQYQQQRQQQIPNTNMKPNGAIPKVPSQPQSSSSLHNSRQLVSQQPHVAPKIVEQQTDQQGQKIINQSYYPQGGVAAPQQYPLQPPPKPSINGHSAYMALNEGPPATYGPQIPFGPPQSAAPPNPPINKDPIYANQPQYAQQQQPSSLPGFQPQQIPQHQYPSQVYNGISPPAAFPGQPVISSKQQSQQSGQQQHSQVYPAQQPNQGVQNWGQPSQFAPQAAPLAHHHHQGNLSQSYQGSIAPQQQQIQMNSSQSNFSQKQFQPQSVQSLPDNSIPFQPEQPYQQQNTFKGAVSGVLEGGDMRSSQNLSQQQPNANLPNKKTNKAIQNQQGPQGNLRQSYQQQYGPIQQPEQAQIDQNFQMQRIPEDNLKQISAQSLSSSQQKAGAAPMKPNPNLQLEGSLPQQQFLQNQSDTQLQYQDPLLDQQQAAVISTNPPLIQSTPPILPPGSKQIPMKKQGDPIQNQQIYQQQQQQQQIQRQQQQYILQQQQKTAQSTIKPDTSLRNSMQSQQQQPAAPYPIDAQQYQPRQPPSQAVPQCPYPQQQQLSTNPPQAGQQYGDDAMKQQYIAQGGPQMQPLPGMIQQQAAPSRQPSQREIHAQNMSQQGVAKGNMVQQQQPQPNFQAQPIIQNQPSYSTMNSKPYNNGQKSAGKQQPSLMWDDLTTYLNNPYQLDEDNRAFEVFQIPRSGENSLQTSLLNDSSSTINEQQLFTQPKQNQQPQQSNTFINGYQYPQQQQPKQEQPPPPTHQYGPAYYQQYPGYSQYPATKNGNPNDQPVPVPQQQGKYLPQQQPPHPMQGQQQQYANYPPNTKIEEPIYSDQNLQARQYPPSSYGNFPQQRSSQVQQHQMQQYPQQMPDGKLQQYGDQTFQPQINPSQKMPNMNSLNSQNNIDNMEGLSSSQAYNLQFNVNNNNNNNNSNSLNIQNGLEALKFEESMSGQPQYQKIAPDMNSQIGDTSQAYQLANGQPPINNPMSQQRKQYQILGQQPFKSQNSLDPSVLAEAGPSEMQIQQMQSNQYAVNMGMYNQQFSTQSSLQGQISYENTFKNKITDTIGQAQVVKWTPNQQGMNQDEDLNLIKEVFNKSNKYDQEMQKAITNDVQKFKQNNQNLTIKATKAENNETVFRLEIKDKKRKDFRELILEVQTSKEAPYEIVECKNWSQLNKSKIPRTNSLMDIIKYWWKFEFQTIEEEKKASNNNQSAPSVTHSLNLFPQTHSQQNMDIFNPNNLGR